MGTRSQNSTRASAFSRVLFLQTLKICSAFFYATFNFCYSRLFGGTVQVFSVFLFQFRVSLINNNPFSSLFMPGEGTNRSDQNYIPHLSLDVCSRKCAINVSFFFLFFYKQDVELYRARVFACQYVTWSDLTVNSGRDWF